MKVSKLNRNKNNPRTIKDDKFKKLCKSITDFPQMMSLRPIVVDENMMVLGGNMRLSAIKHLKMKEIPDNWVRKASDLSEEQKQEFIAKDNIGFGSWDMDILANEWDIQKLNEWGFDFPFDLAVEEEPKEEAEKVKDSDECACPKCGFRWVK